MFPGLESAAKLCKGKAQIRVNDKVVNSGRSIPSECPSHCLPSNGQELELKVLSRSKKGQGIKSSGWKSVCWGSNLTLER